MPSNFDQPSDFQQLIEANDSNNDIAINETTQPKLRSSNRTQVPTKEFIQSVSQQNLTFKPQIIIFNSYYDSLHEDDYTLQDQMNDPITFRVTNNKDTLYYHEAMNAPDRDEFLTAM